MRNKQKQIPERCPRCQSEDISTHMGCAECYNCDYEWPYRHDHRCKTTAKVKAK